MKAEDLLIDVKTADMYGLVREIKITHKPTGLSVCDLVGKSEDLKGKWRLLNKLTMMVIEHEQKNKDCTEV